MKSIFVAYSCAPILVLFLFTSGIVAQYDSEITEVKQYVNGTQAMQYDDGDELKTTSTCDMNNPSSSSLMDFKIEMKYYDENNNVVKEDSWEYTVGVARTETRH